MVKGVYVKHQNFNVIRWTVVVYAVKLDRPKQAGYTAGIFSRYGNRGIIRMVTAQGGFEERKAVVLISGGLDSYTTAAIAKADGYVLYTLSFDYGQRHARELESAREIARSLEAASHLVIHLDLRLIGGSALTDEIDVPLDRSERDIAENIPTTYVPARNTVFLSLALAYAEVIGAEDIFIGVSQVDYSGYPDCRREFIDAFEKLASLATKAAVEGIARFRIHTPLINLTKAQTIRRGLELGLDYSITWSCYQGGDLACGRCDSCKLRLAGFRAAGVKDPLQYAQRTSDT